MFENLNKKEVLYAVQITCPDQEIADQVIEWLYAEHLEDVCQYAEDAIVYGKIIEFPNMSEDEAEPVGVLAVYRFKNHSAFEEYLSEAAEEMRSRGLDAFPEEAGLSYKRWVMQDARIETGS